MSYEIKPHICPYCGQRNAEGDARGPLPGAPEPECIAICDGCGEVGIFTAEMDVRKLTDDEWAELRAATFWPVAQRTIREVRASIDEGRNYL